MSRIFSKPIKRAALERSGGKCEARGDLYGLPAQITCGASLAYGVEFDHHILWANSRDSSFDNCVAVCPRCHKHKSTRHDTPLAAKTVRQKEKVGDGIRHSRNPLPGGRNSRLKKKISGEVVER
jgi:hypothetical protein